MAKRDSRGRFVKKTRAKRRTTSRRRAAPKRRSPRTTSRRRAAPKRRRAPARKSTSRKRTTRRRTTAAARRRRPTYRARRRTRSNPPKFNLKRTAMDVVKLGTCAVGGYATVGLAAYAVDQVGLAKWKLQQIEKNATTPVVKVADVFVRLLASIGLGWAANRFLKDKKCAAAVLVGGAFNAVHSAVEHFVLDTDAGRDLPAPIKGALAGYDGYAGLYSPAELEGVDGYQQAGVDGYQQGPRRLAGGMDGYQQAERSQRYAQAVAGAGY